MASPSGSYDPEPSRVTVPAGAPTWSGPAFATGAEQSIEGSDVVSAGSVNFDSVGAGHGTRVRVRLQYSPPGGKVGAAIVKWLGQDPATEIRADLRQFKQLVESDQGTRSQ